MSKKELIAKANTDWDKARADWAKARKDWKADIDKANAMSDDMEEMSYFLTVDRYGKGRRGIFCSRTGGAYGKDGSPHTDDEMREILGDFYLVLSPLSIPFSEEELEKYHMFVFVPLAEYSNVFGVAYQAEGLVSSTSESSP